jgi:hypothetical protein
VNLQRRLRGLLLPVFLILIVLSWWVDQDTRAATTLFGRTMVQGGWVLPTNDFVQGQRGPGESIDNFAGLRLELGWQTDGSEPWQQVYGFPAYGFGLYAARYDDAARLGGPVAGYGFLVWPVWRTAAWSVSTEFGLGLSYGWEPYDDQDNPDNIAVSAAAAVFIDLGLAAEYRMGAKTSLRGGLSLSHFSNGGTKQPNFGLNQVGVNLGARYAFRAEPGEYTRLPVPPYTPRTDWRLSFSAGVRNTRFDVTNPDSSVTHVSNDYGFALLTPAVYRRISYKSRFGAGLDFTYDNALDALLLQEGIPGSLSTGEKLSLGIFGAYNFIFERAVILLQVGYTLLRHDSEGQLPALYQRMGIRYEFSGGFSAGVSARLHNFGVADYLEWNIGYGAPW